MKTISVVSQKGGAGKTTISINLAIAAALSGKQVVIIDLDPQKSASRWSRLREADNPVIVAGTRETLGELLERAREAQADLVVIDTAPKSESASLSACLAADLVVIPCQASNLDIDAVGDTVNIVELSRKPAIIVLNDCKLTSSLTELAVDALKDYGLPICPVYLGSRVAFIKSLLEGQGVLEFEPKSVSAKEISGLYKFACKHINTKT